MIVCFHHVATKDFHLPRFRRGILTSVRSSMEIHQKLCKLLEPRGFEVYPFKIGWYNDAVQEVFRFAHPYDTLAFVIISTPSMFEKAFIPHLQNSGCSSRRDPLDECIIHYFQKIKQEFPDLNFESYHDFDLTPTRRPKVLVQTAGHVAGAAYYYQQTDVQNHDWNSKKRICGVSIHPKYGGWFALRGALIFNDIQVPDLPRKLPVDILPDNKGRIELLKLFNYHWQDWRFRDVVPVTEKYSDLQKLYFATLPRDRQHVLDKIVEISSNVKDLGHVEVE